MTTGRMLLLTMSAVVWIGVCSILLITGIVELLYPEVQDYRNGVLVFYLGIRVVGFPLGTLAFYMVNIVLSQELSSMTKLWVYWATVVLVGGVQWFVVMPKIVRSMLGVDADRPSVLRNRRR